MGAHMMLNTFKPFVQVEKNRAAQLANLSVVIAQKFEASPALALAMVVVVQ